MAAGRGRVYDSQEGKRRRKKEGRARGKLSREGGGHVDLLCAGTPARRASRFFMIGLLVDGSTVDYYLGEEREAEKGSSTSC